MREREGGKREKPPSCIAHVQLLAGSIAKSFRANGENPKACSSNSPRVSSRGNAGIPQPLRSLAQSRELGDRCGFEIWVSPLHKKSHRRCVSPVTSALQPSSGGTARPSVSRAEGRVMWGLAIFSFVAGLAVLGFWFKWSPPGTSGSQHPVLARAGLLDRLELAQLERYPDTSLPPDLDVLRGQSVLVAALLPEQYEWMGIPPNSPLAPAIQRFTTKLPDTVPPRADVRFVSYSHERPSEVVPLPDISLDPTTRVAAYVGALAPADSWVVHENDFEGHLKGFEHPSGATPLRPAEILRRVELEGVTRETLVLPSPGIVSYAFDSLHFSALSVAVGVRDQGWKRLEGILFPAERRSDGVTFRVEVEEHRNGDLLRQEVWSRHVLPGEGFVTDSVDLSEYRGRRLRLRLISDVGPEGDASFDYAVWGDLNLSGVDARPLEMPHVVLVVVDTLRPDRMGSYGYSRPTTPRLDDWARRHAMVFSDATATANWTLPSAVSILTGLRVSEHQVGGSHRRLTSQHRPLSLVLAEAGYETYGFCEGGWMSADYGFAEGFDFYDCDSFQDPPWEQAVGVIRSRKKEAPVFLFLHTYMVHTPFAYDPRVLPSDGFGGRLAGAEVTDWDVFNPIRMGKFTPTSEEMDYIRLLYDAGLQRLDEQIGAFLESLEIAVEDDDLLVVVTSDHGEEFFDHGRVGHGHTLYTELLQIPLLIRFPDERTGVSSSPVGAIDIVPTILDAAGIPEAASLPGVSLRTPVPEDRLRVAGDVQRGKTLGRAIQQGGFKLIESLRGSGRPELYDLSDDPAETRNLYSQKPEVVSRLRRAAASQVLRGPGIPEAEPVPVRRETKRMLRALGYTVD